MRDVLEMKAVLIASPGGIRCAGQYAGLVTGSGCSGCIRIESGRDRLGEQVLLIPRHGDPTANLSRKYDCFRDDRNEEIWDIDDQGLSR